MNKWKKENTGNKGNGREDKGGKLKEEEKSMEGLRAETKKKKNKWKRVSKREKHWRKNNWDRISRKKWKGKKRRERKGSGESDE